MKKPQSPIRPTDDEAHALACALVAEARFGALGVLAPDTGEPVVSRVAVIWQAGPVTLISELSDHTRALRADPAASLLLGEPGAKGDPLTWPRISLQGRARFVERGSAAHDALRATWLERHPKARLYIDFTDFSFVRLAVAEAHLNGGFGKAYRLTPEDLGLGAGAG
jgi:putative heme iron utilization protein